MLGAPLLTQWAVSAPSGETLWQGSHFLAGTCLGTTHSWAPGLKGGRAARDSRLQVGAGDRPPAHAHPVLLAPFRAGLAPSWMEAGEQMHGGWRCRVPGTPGKDAWRGPSQPQGPLPAPSQPGLTCSGQVASGGCGATLHAWLLLRVPGPAISSHDSQGSARRLLHRPDHWPPDGPASPPGPGFTGGQRGHQGDGPRGDLESAEGKAPSLSRPEEGRPGAPAAPVRRQHPTPGVWTLRLRPQPVCAGLAPNLQAQRSLA